jgi:hypothetical protein
MKREIIVVTPARLALPSLPFTSRRLLRNMKIDKA